MKHIGDKILTIANLATTATLTAVKNKILSVSALVQKTDYADKVKEIEGKCYATSDYNKFKNNILDAKIKN